MDAMEILRAATAFGISVVNLSDQQAASESLHSVKFDGIVVDAESDGAASVLVAASASASNKVAPVMCIVPPHGAPPFVSCRDVSVIFPKPVSRAGALTSMKLLWMKMVAERRRYFRCPVEFDVFCTPPTAVRHLSQAQNISQGGIAITADLKPSEVVTLHFTIPGQGRELSATGQVVWSNNGVSAICFLAMPKQDKHLLYEWLGRKCDESLGISYLLCDPADSIVSASGLPLPNA